MRCGDLILGLIDNKIQKEGTWDEGALVTYNEFIDVVDKKNQKLDILFC